MAAADIPDPGTLATTLALLIRDGQVFAAGDIHHTLTSDKISESFGFGLNVDFTEGRFRVRAR